MAKALMRSLLNQIKKLRDQELGPVWLAYMFDRDHAFEIACCALSRAFVRQVPHALSSLLHCFDMPVQFEVYLITWSSPCTCSVALQL